MSKPDRAPDIIAPQTGIQLKAKVWVEEGIISFEEDGHVEYMKILRVREVSEGYITVQEYMDYVLHNKNHGHHIYFYGYVAEQILLED